ncbi:transcriptional regulator [Hydrogenovibrio sp. SC-1]|uniref:ROK family protein n=1 Tax=Hydrogenovibrio sp. SC-1 TaxID=2065820 RepID=UPI000C7D430E|nr:ROK family protein [Hydrogenovibrio sp. SC-1]PLA74745.1 transcriptional regulator [Hydrogenovibrio sp. SC-1]
MKVGIDLGGTKIEVAVLDDENQLVFRQRVATPQGDYEATCGAIVGLVRQVQQQFGHFSGLGVAIPGAISKKTGLIKNANSTCLIGRDLQADLQAALNMKVALANDANCLALSEASDGAAAGEDVVFAVIVGTGCGGGLVVNGQVINGINAIAGEWGHNPMPWLDSAERHPDCYCGLKGCIETFLSGPALSSHFLEKTDRCVTAKQLAEQAKQGDEAAQAMLETYANWMAKALASVINVVDPDVIVLGGGLSNMEWLYQRVPQIWQQWVFSDQVETRLVPAKWGDSSGVRGAAWLTSNQR